jgi:hypothetical protein
MHMPQSLPTVAWLLWLQVLCVLGAPDAPYAAASGEQQRKMRGPAAALATSFTAVEQHIQQSERTSSKVRLFGAASL